MDDQARKILEDLDSHRDIFDMDRNDLGENLLDVAVDGVQQRFDSQTDPDGQAWPQLQSEYKRWKDKNYPGEPIGVLEGLMRSEIDGERAIETNSAEWTYGKTQEARDEATWFSEGDPVQNRKPRPFADLNEQSVRRSDQILDNHFERETR